MISMTRWLLETRAATDIHFFHSARSEDEFIFRNELQTLATEHTNLKLHLFLTRPQGRLPMPSRSSGEHTPAGTAARSQ